jgi:hypothetical protein
MAAPQRDQQTTEWFRTQRGIRPETLDAFGVTGSFPESRYTYPNGTKVRPDFADRRRYWDPPLGRDDIRLYQPVAGDAVADRRAEVVFLVEGESDTMCLWQHLRDAGKLGSAGVVGLSGVNTWDARHVPDFGDAHTVYVILDNDDPYENPQAVDSVESVWARVRADLGRRAVRVRLPRGIKDVCEFFKAYDYAAFQQLCRTTPRASWHWKPVDFSQPVPQRDWLLEDVLHHRTFNLLVADPGMGKSMVTMGLAVALLEGWPTFLGKAVKHHGRVYYIDEENPLDVVLQRLSRLGLSERGADPDMLRYMHNTGADFDENWDFVRDEILQFEPELVVVDSLSETTHVDENSKAEMGPVLERIKSLSRDLDTTVVLIHHANTASGRARGSGHIRASTDAEWWIGPSEHDASLMRMECRKHRHGIQRGEMLPFRIEDAFEPDGTKRIVLKPTLQEDVF